MNHLRVVLQVLKEHQLFAKYRKCEFCLRLVTFICHIIYSEGVEVDPRKTEVVKYWPKRMTPTEISSLLGLAGYYQRFVEGFSIASPLTTLTQQYKKFY